MSSRLLSINEKLPSQIDGLQFPTSSTSQKLN